MTVFERTLVTSALPYANGHIHLGHIAGAYLPADIYVRFKRLRGEKVIYVCGSDEHGVPITLRALKEGKSPGDVIDEYHNANQKAFASLNISFDIYGRTSWPLHVETTQRFFRNLYAAGHIVKREIELWFSPGLNRFLPDRYVMGTCPKCGYNDANGDECENCGAQYAPRELLEPRSNVPNDDSSPILKKSVHWFLKLQDFKQKLQDWLDTHPEWRANTRGIAYGWVRELKERCITRDTDWGVPIPLEDPDIEGKRIYVWFDAPIGYVTNTRQWGIDLFGDENAWENWWKDSGTRLVHFIGKDNVPFHAVIFPAMLMGQEDFILADKVPSNDYLNIYNRRTGREEKGSKSKGNMISVKWMSSKVSADAIRYYLCAIMPETSDSAFDWDAFRDRYNGELCDVAGNFIHRSLTMTYKNFSGKVPNPEADFDAADREMLDALPKGLNEIVNALEEFRFRLGLEKFIDIARKANRYFDSRQPWKTRKTDMARTATTLYVCCQVVRALATAMAPFLPDGSAAVLEMLGEELPEGGHAGGVNAWRLPAESLAAGAELKKPRPVFPKIEEETVAALAEEHLAGRAY